MTEEKKKKAQKPRVALASGSLGKRLELRTPLPAPPCRAFTLDNLDLFVTNHKRNYALSYCRLAVNRDCYVARLPHLPQNALPGCRSAPQFMQRLAGDTGVTWRAWARAMQIVHFRRESKRLSLSSLQEILQFVSE